MELGGGRLIEFRFSEYLRSRRKSMKKADLYS